MPLLTTAARLNRAPDVTAQTVAEEAILIHLKTGVYYSLNAVGTVFWNALDGERSIGDHAGAIAAQYTAPREMVESDLIELAGQLHNEGLVIVSNGAQADGRTE